MRTAFVGKANALSFNSSFTPLPVFIFYLSPNRDFILPMFFLLSILITLFYLFLIPCTPLFLTRVQVVLLFLFIVLFIFLRVRSSLRLLLLCFIPPRNCSGLKFVFLLAIALLLSLFCSVLFIFIPPLLFLISPYYTPPLLPPRSIPIIC